MVNVIFDPNGIDMDYAQIDSFEIEQEMPGEEEFIFVEMKLPTNRYMVVAEDENSLVIKYNHNKKREKKTFAVPPIQGIDENLEMFGGVLDALAERYAAKKPQKPWVVGMNNRIWKDTAGENFSFSSTILRSDGKCCRAVVVRSSSEEGEVDTNKGIRLAVRRALRGIADREKERVVADPRAIKVLSISGCPFSMHVEMHPDPTPQDVIDMMPESTDYWMEYLTKEGNLPFWCSIAKALAKKKRHVNVEHLFIGTEEKKVKPKKVARKTREKKKGVAKKYIPKAKLKKETRHQKGGKKK